jgi:hypothetical protein
MVECSEGLYFSSFAGMTRRAVSGGMGLAKEGRQQIWITRRREVNGAQDVQRQ